MQSEQQDFFWPSYVDFMTTLFIVMLVLFVLTYKVLHDKNTELQAKLLVAEDIEALDSAMIALQDGDLFEYQPLYKRHVLKQQVLFDPHDDKIPEEFYDALVRAGEKLSTVVRNLPERVRCQLVIEGRAARQLDEKQTPSGWYDPKYPYNLSYRRALALYRFWQSRNIFFDEKKCEVIVAGSGFDGVGRDVDEDKNKRFIIHLVPKIGE